MAGCCRAAEKSGARNGLASCRETTDCGTTRRSVSGGRGRGSPARDLLRGRLDAGGPQHVALERPGRVGDDGVLGEQREQRGVAGGGLREDRRDAVEALELLGPVAVAAGLVGLDPGALLAHQQRDGLELRAHGGVTRSALDGRLDLAHGAGEHRDDAVVAGRGRVAGSAGRDGERPSGAGLVEPQLPPLECRARVAAAACRTPPPDGRGRSEAPAWCLERRAACGSEGSTPRVSAISSREHRATTGGPVTTAGHAVGQPPPWSESTHVNACEASRFRHYARAPARSRNLAWESPTNPAIRRRATADEGSPTVRTLHFGLHVADLDRALAFYTALRYEVVGSVPETGIGPWRRLTGARPCGSARAPR